MADDEKGFEIRDRRKVTPEGEIASDAPREEAARGGLHEHGGEPHAHEAPPVDFISFLGSLGASALMHLGEKLGPDQPDDLKDLAAAKHMIGLIDLLKEKTKGNLTQEEADFLESLVYNLKMRYVRETTGQK